MDEKDRHYEKCEIINAEIEKRYRAEIPDIVNTITESCLGRNCFDHVDAAVIPSRDEVIEIIDLMRKILYPGYFDNRTLDRNNLHYHIGNAITDLFEKLSRQITNSIIHECQRYGEKCTECVDRGQAETIKFLKKIPEIRRVLATDVIASYNGDPAARSYDEVIFSYPGLFAVTIYRVAHELHKQDITLLPRIMTEYAHNTVGIDIHPAASIGHSFFIDHGTGVVIGETCSIGNNVRVYQGVTLGALSFPKDERGKLIKGHKRHPTIEDDVIIYSGATILGGDTVIGARSVIGGNVWITEPVPPDTKVMIEKPNLVYRERKNS
ncbi:Serine O-acetyltransferase [Methanosalsum zhilinae DSM 4017]|uniref:Serine O-acetyltransferase n=1 Tax=Methanosalsum zhilinae (strain DSM 4017 / NBRC 107636 / OCM 62 / WeN5) TaxID=679901 RepID=F7XL39_METZD|nr:serine acetyltransferase [Methanosalsum zhilinae]AEH61851.1 Serine O-acetyltransferase [Methanosalsum zhilinae DSM 4017]